MISVYLLLDYGWLQIGRNFPFYWYYLCKIIVVNLPCSNYFVILYFNIGISTSFC